VGYVAVLEAKSSETYLRCVSMMPKDKEEEKKIANHSAFFDRVGNVKTQNTT
jgi:hypothetical protein